MKRLQSLGAGCFIITSGTLSPLESFHAEMEIPFPVTLENGHVIKENQLKICTIGQRKDIEFDSRYTNRDNQQYIRALGETLVDYFRIIPDGVLVFFSSYVVMNKTLDTWSRMGLLDRINDIKEVVREPSDKYSFDECLKKYRQVIDEKEKNGAAFFGVCRGKLSEGLDISDDHCRGVFVIGLPFPAFADTKAVLKREYLNAKRDSKLTADVYYSMQMKRGLNQAIGRIIRHRDDYGVVVLMDKRFAQHQNSLSKWLRPYFQSCDYDTAFNTILNFFGNVRFEGRVRSDNTLLVHHPPLGPRVKSEKCIVNQTMATSSSKPNDDSKQLLMSYRKPEPPKEVYPIFKKVVDSKKRRVDMFESESKADDDVQIMSVKKKPIVPLKSVSVDSSLTEKTTTNDNNVDLHDHVKKHGPRLKEILKDSKNLKTLIVGLKVYKECKDIEKFKSTLDGIITEVKSDERDYMIEVIAELLETEHRSSFCQHYLK